MKPIFVFACVIILFLAFPTGTAMTGKKAQSQLLGKMKTNKLDAKPQNYDNSLEKIEANMEYKVEHDIVGNTLSNVVFKAKGKDKNGEDKANMLFSFSKIGGAVNLTITADIEKNDKARQEGCEGFWRTKTNTILRDKNNWFKDNCYLYLKNQDNPVNLNTQTNFDAITGSASSTYAWVCNYEGSFWTFNIQICDWVPISENPIVDSRQALIFLQQKSKTLNQNKQMMSYMFASINTYQVGSPYCQ